MRTPDHYDFAIQPVEYILRNKLGFCEGNVVKYISRYQNKNGREDLMKARHYIDILIKAFDEDCKNAFLDKGDHSEYNNNQS